MDEKRVGVGLASGRRANLADTVFGKLKEEILAGGFAQDALLPTQEELALRFGVSRTVMRDAFHKLSSLGFIEIRQGKGSFVRSSAPISIVSVVPSLHSSFTMDDSWIQDLMEARYYLEVSIARLAAKKVSSGGLAFLEENVARMEEAVHSGDSAAFISCDLEFHEKLAEICGNHILKQTLTAIRGAMKSFFAGLSKIPSVPSRSLAYHKALYKAIVSRDAEKASSVMKAHMANVISNLKKNYNIDVLL